MLRISKKDLQKIIDVYCVKLSDPNDRESYLKRYYVQTTVEKWMRSIKQKNDKLAQRGFIWLHTVFETEAGYVVVAEWTPPCEHPVSHIAKGGWHCTDTLTTWDYRRNRAKDVLVVRKDN